MSSPESVPPALKGWFIFHFVADLLFALPLYFAPRAFLGLLGWTEVDPATTRLVAAALFGIGIQSLVGRDEPPEAFRAMLNLKMIWSSTATLGLVASVLFDGGPPMVWGFVAIFGGFFFVWTYWRLRLRRAELRLARSQMPV